MTSTSKLALAGLLGPFSLSFASAQSADAELPTLPDVQVIAPAGPMTSEGSAWSPAQTMSGDALRNRIGQSVGDLLQHESGVTSSGTGAASRPVIRGMDGSRVKILQNGMSVMDLSTLSPDHATGVATGSARQVEIVRGPRALLFGSGLIGGTVNVVNERIPTFLPPKASGEAEFRIGSVDRSSAGTVVIDGAAGNIGLHVDASALDAGNYRIPGYRVRDDPASGSGRLAQTWSRQQSLGAGGSVIGNWGYAGISVATLANRYGVPTEDGANIDLDQQRVDFDAMWQDLSPILESFRIRIGHTDYRHVELDSAQIPETGFSNRGWESRLEWQHRPLAGWRGHFGLQWDQQHTAVRDATSGAATVLDPTRSTSVAAFIAEERDFGALNISAGARLEATERRPATLAARNFRLGSLSAAAAWNFTPGYSVGATLTTTQRAPGAEELYFNGPHHATETFDRGRTDLRKETSRSLELALQKTRGLVRWKANLFQTRVGNFIHGELTGRQLDDDGLPGGELNERVFSQADARLHGAELEASFNRDGPGISLRGFADVTRGRFINGGSLPLQPAARIGIEGAYRDGPWQAGLSVLRARTQDRLATFETRPTPGYTLLDAHLSHTRRLGDQSWTVFLIARNLLNQDVRLSTSMIKDFAPQPGRNVVIGVRTRF